MDLFKKIEAQLRASNFKTWLNLNNHLDQSDNTIQRRIKSRINKLNADLGLIGLELDIKERPKKLINN